MRFRQEKVAMMADVESMFYQVKVPDDQLKYLKFLWWPDGNLEADLEEYEMTVHPFGAVSSPSCANYALRRTANDNEAQFGPAIANVLKIAFTSMTCYNQYQHRKSEVRQSKEQLK